MLIYYLYWAIFILSVLLFLGFCHFCFNFHRMVWCCPNCGFQRPYKDLGQYVQPSQHAVRRLVVIERCDSPSEACVNSEMKLINRKWRWIFSRPFAWIWAPLYLFANQITEIIKSFK